VYLFKKNLRVLAYSSDGLSDAKLSLKVRSLVPIVCHSGVFRNVRKDSKKQIERIFHLYKNI